MAPNAIACRYFDRPPLGDVLFLPDEADPPSTEYLQWHQQRVFACECPKLKAQALTGSLAGPDGLG
jgi:hypothetical protein